MKMKWVKFLVVGFAVSLTSLEAYSQKESQVPESQYYENQPQYQQNPNPNYQSPEDSQQQKLPPPNYQYGSRPSAYPERTNRSYLKFSTGWANLKEHQDASGELSFEDSTFTPLNIGLGVTAARTALELELGFSFYDYEFTPSLNSPDTAFDDNLGASKLMVNLIFKTAEQGSHLYVGGGLGLVSVFLDNNLDDLSGSSFAAQFILGGELKISPRTGFFVEYKQFESLGLELESDALFLEDEFVSLDFDFSEASLNVGLRTYF